MPKIETVFYRVFPSDDPEWILVEAPDGTIVDVEIRVLDYRFDCKPSLVTIGDRQIPCSRLCCYAGCYISPKEIEETKKILPELKPYLTEDAKAVLSKFNDQFYIPEDHDEEEDLYKTRCAPEEWEYDDEEDVASENLESEDYESEAFEEEDVESSENEQEDASDVDPSSEKWDTDQEQNELSQKEQIPENYCIFLMENGLCAVHKYYVDKGMDWVKHKFNICTTFPLDIRPQDMTLAFMRDFDEFTFAHVDCIALDNEKKAALGMPQVIDSMKYAIVDRYGESFWKALKHVGEDYRQGKIDLSFLYPDNENEDVS